MAGPHPAKFELEDARVYIHVKDETSGANVTHIDVEHPAFNEIIESDENTFVGGKDGGVFIGLKEEIATDVGLEFVYVGNVPGHEYNSTYCPDCGRAWILRRGFDARVQTDLDEPCPCGREIPIVT